jgi:hypothetical protein
VVNGCAAKARPYMVGITLAVILGRGSGLSGLGFLERGRKLLTPSTGGHKSPIPTGHQACTNKPLLEKGKQDGLAAY